MLPACLPLGSVALATEPSVECWRFSYLRKYDCHSVGGVPTAAFDPAKPTAVEGTTVQMCRYGTFTQELESTSLDQCCKCTRTQEEVQAVHAVPPHMHASTDGCTQLLLAGLSQEHSMLHCANPLEEKDV